MEFIVFWDVIPGDGNFRLFLDFAVFVGTVFSEILLPRLWYSGHGIAD
jgi:hypothetical protein